MSSDFSLNYEKDTWVHRLDPRTKLIYIIIFATVPLFFTEFSYLLGCAMLILPVWISAKIDIRPIKVPWIRRPSWRRWRRPAP